MSTHSLLVVNYQFLLYVAPVNGIDDAANSGRKRRRATVSPVNIHFTTVTLLHCMIKHLADITG
jgi:hypothetical protein